MTQFLPFERPEFFKRWWHTTVLQNLKDNSTKNVSRQAKIQLKATKDRSTLHAWLYLLHKVNSNSKPSKILHKKTIKQLDKLFKTVQFNWYDEKANYYEYLPEMTFSKDLVVTKGKKDLNAILTSLILELNQNQLAIHDQLITIFNVLNWLPDELSLKGFTILNKNNNNNHVPALQVLFNIVFNIICKLRSNSDPRFPNWQLVTNICVQFMRRGYSLNDFNNNEKDYELPLFFCAIKIAIEYNFTSLLEMFLEKTRNINWNTCYTKKHLSDPFRHPDSDFQFQIPLNKNEEFVFRYSNNGNVIRYKLIHVPTAEFVLGRGNFYNESYSCLGKAEMEGGEMCKWFKNYIKILELLMDKGMQFPKDWYYFVCRHNCLFVDEVGFEFLKKLHWAGVDVTGMLQFRGFALDICFPQKNKHPHWYKGLLKYIEWFENQKLSLRLLYLARRKVRGSLNIGVMEQEIKIGVRPQGFKSLIFNYKHRIEEKKPL